VTFLLQQSHAPQRHVPLSLVCLSLVGLFNHGSSKREVPLLLKRQQLRKLFAAASSSSLQLHCTKIYFNEGGWAKARIVAARKELPPDKRRDTAERQLRRRDDHDE
jgi:tmRNA-binding protein